MQFIIENGSDCELMRPKGGSGTQEGSKDIKDTNGLSRSQTKSLEPDGRLSALNIGGNDWKRRNRVSVSLL